MYLHGVDSNSQSRIIPIHFIFFTSFIVCRAVLMSCPNSIDPQGYDDNKYAHTDHNNNSSHTWNNWNKKWKSNRLISMDQIAYKTLNTLSIFFSFSAPVPSAWDSGHLSDICLGLQKVVTCAHLLGHSIHEQHLQTPTNEYYKPLLKSDHA